MLPNPKRIADRIFTALKGQSSGLETAKLAQQYFDACIYANERFQAFTAAIAAKDPLKAYHLATSEPNLLDTFADLKLSNPKAWENTCETLKFTAPPALDQKAASEIRLFLEGEHGSKEYLFSEYREAIREKKIQKALNIIQSIDASYPEDPTAASEKQRLQKQVKKSIAGKLSETLFAESDSTWTKIILQEVADAGLESKDFGDSLSSMEDAYKAQLASETNQLFQALIEEGKSEREANNWIAIEKRLLEFDSHLFKDDSRGLLTRENKDVLTETTTWASHLRNNWETEETIRKSIKSIHDAIAAKVGPKIVQEAASTLKQQEIHFGRLHQRISPELKREIQAALKAASSNNLPRTLLLSIAAASIMVVIVVGGLKWTKSSSFEKERNLVIQAVEQSRAKADLNQLESNLVSARQLLEKHRDELPKLGIVYEANKNWLQSQKVLLSQFDAQAKKLETLKSGNLTDQNVDTFTSNLAKAGNVRKDLDARLGLDIDKRIQASKLWLTQTLEQKVKDSEDALTEIVNDSKALAASLSTTKESLRLGAGLKQFKLQIGQAIELNNVQENAALGQEIAKLESQLHDLELKFHAYNSLQANLFKTKTLAEYLEQLQRLQQFDLLERGKRRSLDKILESNLSFEDIEKDVVFKDQEKAWESMSGDTNYTKAQLQLSDVERIFLQRLTNDSTFENVYQSKVKYFEGEQVAQSEYTTFLVEPVEKDQMTLKTGTNYQFTVRGYDENGDTERKPREMNFLSHPDGSFWGFFYEPSELSNESLFYKSTLQPTLTQIIAGSSRFTILNLIEIIRKNHSLSPSFSAYWQNELMDFMQLDPWKWAWALTPTLQAEFVSLQKLSKGSIAKRQWLSSIEQAVPSIELTDFFRKANQMDCVAEAKAFATLYQSAADIDMSFRGYANTVGEIKLGDPAKIQGLWGLEQHTYRLVACDSTTFLAPFSPVLELNFKQGKPKEILRKIRLLTGINLSDKKYRKNLPAMFVGK